MERLLEHSSLLSIARELNALCVDEGVVGYHYTRSFRERILNGGVLATTGAARRQMFLDEFSDLFTLDQRNRLVAGWDDYFDRGQNNARDGRVFFNLTLDALGGGGSRPLLSYYGGEAIYMPFKWDDEISQKLQTLGEPLIVKCALDTRSLRTFSDIPWGKVWLSTYHLSVNSDAYRFDVDVYCNHSIPAANIISVQSAEFADL